MSKWTEVQRKRLGEALKDSCPGTHDSSIYWSSNTRTDDLRAALAEIERQTKRADDAERAKYGTPCKCEAWIEACRITELRAEAAEAKLAEAQTSIKLQAAALDVWRAANPDGTGGMLGALAAERERERELRQAIRDADAGAAEAEHYLIDPTPTRAGNAFNQIQQARGYLRAALRDEEPKR
jgi:hypothetical protein